MEGLCDDDKPLARSVFTHVKISIAQDKAHSPRLKESL